MANYVARLATTGVVRQGITRMPITKENLEEYVAFLNGDRAVPIIVEHDPFCMPISKFKEAWIEPSGDGHSVMARIHEEDSTQQLTHTLTGTQMVLLRFQDVPKPFMPTTEKIEADGVKVSIDLANFDSAKGYEDFSKDVNQIDEEIALEGIGRHSLIPEPLLQIIISNPEIAFALTVGGYWTLRRVEKFVRYTIDETARKAADDISDLLIVKIRSILGSYKKHRSKDDRPTVSKIVIPGDVTLVLLARTENPEESLSLNLSELTAEMEKYGDLLQKAQEVTFSQVGVDAWEFQYLKTRTGEVLGTPTCFDRTLQRYKNLNSTDDNNDG